MIEQTISLESGRSLQQRRGSGAWILQPEARTVEVERAGEVVRITDPDTGQTATERIAQQKPRKPAGRPARASTGSADGSRWATLNVFVDQALADLSRVEMAVWLVLYRDTRDGMARTGMADIARRAGCHKGSVVRAVQSLQARGLVRVVRRGRKNGGTSVYVVSAAPLDAQGRRKPR